MKLYNYKILLAEDDENLGFVIADNLQILGFEVSHVKDGIEAFQMFQKNTFDLCLIDVMMPLEDGFSLTRKIRLINKDIPIIFLTAKGLKEDKIIGFNIGADDYMVKPFSMEELVLRIKVFLRRTGVKFKKVEQSNFILGKYTFCFANLELLHEVESKRLTMKEASLLKLLIENEGNMVKREDILRVIWGTDDYFAGRSMDVFISKLRKYLRYDSSLVIMNYHGSGFKLLIK